MVETLTGALSGAAMAGQVGNWLRTPDAPTDTGFFLLTIDVGSGGPFDGFSDRVRQLCEEITTAPRAPGVERIYVPGELEHEHEAAARANGVRLPAEVWSGLGEVATLLHLEHELRAVVR